VVTTTIVQSLLFDLIIHVPLEANLHEVSIILVLHFLLLQPAISFPVVPYSSTVLWVGLIKNRREI
jgi:hypothetical protein